MQVYLALGLNNLSTKPAEIFRQSALSWPICRCATLSLNTLYKQTPTCQQQFSTHYYCPPHTCRNYPLTLTRPYLHLTPPSRCLCYHDVQTVDDVDGVCGSVLPTRVFIPGWAMALGPCRGGCDFGNHAHCFRYFVSTWQFRSNGLGLHIPGPRVTSV